MCNPKICTVASVLPASGGFRLFTWAEEKKKKKPPVWSAQLAMNQCSQPKLWQGWLDLERTFKNCFSSWSGIWTPHWLKSQGLLGGCKAQAWQALTSSKPLTPWSNNIGTMQSLSIGATDLPPIDGHSTAAPGNHGDPTLLDYEVLCFQPLEVFAMLLPWGRRIPREEVAKCDRWEGHQAERTG